MDSRAYWVWVQNAIGPGSGKLRRILERYVSPAQFYQAGPEDWRGMRLFTNKELKEFSRFSLEDSARLIAEHEKAGQQVITPEDSRYPEKLRQIYDLPAVLFVQGTLPNLDDGLSIAMVGTRRGTWSGLSVARNLSRELTRRGVVIVSGGAIGIDTAAHNGSLDENGKTICVLGCGIGYPYLADREAMRRAITKRGALVSEFPKNTPPGKWTFPVRNRIISGLCDGTVVVEAGMASGAMITAKDAREQNRDLFAVPGNVNEPSSAGVNSLIQSGAKMVTKAEDILEEYAARYPALYPREGWYVACQYYPKPKAAPLAESAQPAETSRAAPPMPRQPSEAGHAAPTPLDTRDSQIAPARQFDGTPQAKRLLDVLEREPQHISVLCEKAGLSAREALSAVTELELEDLILGYSGSRYSLPAKPAF